jgi:hypothetical protein
MRKSAFSEIELREIARIQSSGVTRKTAIRKMKAAAKTERKDKRQTAKVAVPPGASRAKKTAKLANKTTRLPASVVAANRAEGRRLFKIAGCPTREQVVAIYGQRVPLMTWRQRKVAGVSAEEFQKALAKR